MPTTTKSSTPSPVIRTTPPPVSKGDGHELVNQIFKLGYCGLDDPSFWNWCKDPDFKPRETKCRNIKHSKEDVSCKGLVHFVNKTYLDFQERCRLGNADIKDNIEFYQKPLNPGEFEDVTSFCKARDNWPWWLIALIVLAVLLVLAFSFWVFWRTYLRRRVSPTTRERKEMSMLRSRFTSAPLTSMMQGNSTLHSLYTMNPSSAANTRSGARASGMSKARESSSSRAPGRRNSFSAFAAEQ